MPHPEIEQLEPQIEKLSLKWLTTNFWIFFQPTHTT